MKTIRTFIREIRCHGTLIFFFFTDTATTEIYTLSLHDALPISLRLKLKPDEVRGPKGDKGEPGAARSEEHTSELQSQFHLVCRLLLEKKNIKKYLMPHVHNENME